MSESSQCQPVETAEDRKKLEHEARAIFARAQKGDESVREVFREMLDDPRVGAKVVEMFGNLAARTGDFAVDHVAQTNLAIKEATPRKMAKLRAELEGPDPSPIERLLVERVVFCWLMLWEYECMLLLQAGNLALKQSEFYHRRIDAAHRRYLSSLRTLATVRRLAAPIVRAHAGAPHRHAAEAPEPCTCHAGVELPVFGDRFSRVK